MQQQQLDSAVEYNVALLDASGQLVVLYQCERQFGRIQRAGVWYQSKRMHYAPECPINVYFEEAAA